MSFDFARYLNAKKSVDDRALNRQVWRALQQALATHHGPLRVLEMATGTGAMLERLLTWETFPPEVVYTAIDHDAALLSEARQNLIDWATTRHFDITTVDHQTVYLRRDNQQLTVTWVQADVFDFIASQSPASWDLLLAHAFLDLVDLNQLLPNLLALLKATGHFYFTINFDGETIFQPAVNPAWDELITARYHQRLNAARIGAAGVGGVRSGRAMFQALPPAGGRILQAGSSDWVVFAPQQQYPAEEAYFLHCILNTLAETLQNDTDLPLADWLTARRRQIETGELVYIAHQLDCFGVVNR